MNCVYLNIFAGLFFFFFFFRPMDLNTIKKNIKQGVVTSTAELKRDLLLVVLNAMTYYKKGEQIYEMAEEMKQHIFKVLQVCHNSIFLYKCRK